MFEKRSKERQDEFNREFEIAKTWAMIWGIFVALLGLSSLGFIGWVIVKFMQHFGII